MDETSPAALRFGLFELDLVRGELRKEGVPLRLQPQPWKVLVHLASRPGEIVTREELKKELWGEEEFVDFERGLNSCVLLVRTALGDDAQSPRFVRTLPRRGYQFVAPVERIARQAAGAPRVSSAPAVPAAATAAPDPPGAPEPASTPPAPRRRFGLAAAGLATLALLAVAGAALRSRPRDVAPPAAPRRAVLAVLPFENLDAAREDEDFADGLTEELITRLGTVDPAGLGVIARTSVMRFKGKRAGVREIGKELGADHVLEGSVRRGGGRLRITAQLIRVSDETHLWAETYDRAPGDTIAVQDDVASRVARSVSPRFAGAAPRRPRSPAAQEAYVRGRALFAKGSPEALAGAVAALETAVALAPNDAAAHAALADAYHVHRMRASLPPREVYPKAEAAARKAVALDPALGAAHTALAAVLLWYHWDAEGARAELKTALELNPSDAAALHDTAFLVSADDPDAAVAAIRKARELDPLSPRANVDVGWVYLRTRRYDDALSQCRATLELEPGFAAAEACVEQSLVKLGREAEAVAFTRRLLAAAGATPADLAALDALPPREAQLAARRFRLRRMEERARDGYVSGYALAVERAALGEDAGALDALESAFAAREPMLYRIDADPAFESLRADARFAKLARNVRSAAMVAR